MTRRWLRWVPAALVPAVIAAGTLLGSLPASAGDPLPAKTAAEVLQLLGQHRKQALSGTVEKVAELGLPALPRTMSGRGPAAPGWLEFLTGSHTARVYSDGADKARVQVLDRMAERDLIKNGHEWWSYNSKDNTVSHYSPPAHAWDHHGGDKSVHEGMRGLPDGHGWRGGPERLTEMLLAKVDKSTAVTVGDDLQVAGRAAYNLQITPRSTVTLLESMAIAVDGENGMPLSVTINARGQSAPAFRMAYTKLSLEAPDASLFAFSPPPGATVKELPDPERKPGGSWHDGTPGERMLPGTPGAPGQGMLPDRESRDSRWPTVTGSGWETVIGFPAGSADALFSGTADQALPGQSDQDLRGGTDPAGPDSGATDVGAAALLEQALTPVPGGRLLSTSLMNMLILDDGRIYVGSVPLERLQAAAAAP